MAFQNRWSIEGTLTTIAPLHVGSGDITTRENLFEPSEDGSERRHAEVAAVAIDAAGRAYVPGTALKGVARSWLHRHGATSDVLEKLFGIAGSAADEATGTVRIEPRAGAVEWWDARATPEPVRVAQLPPYWDPRRLTGVRASVTINRRVRAAEAQRLFHIEFVPPGVAFDVTVTGQNLDDDEIALLLRVLEAFNDSPDGLSVGAATVDGWGRLCWTLRTIRSLTAADVEAWIARPDRPVGYDALVPLAPDRVATLVSRSRDPLTSARRVDASPPEGAVAKVPVRAVLRLELELTFDGPLLVNDPSQTGEHPRPDRAPLRDHRGRALLPAASLRGALRSQAERILRTLAGNPDVCCTFDAGRPGARSCTAVHRLSDFDSGNERRPCLICRLFGVSGWRSPIGISDFTASDYQPGTEVRQELVAIDRFTGAVAGKKKFSAAAVWRPVLTGTITIDLGALGRADVGPEGVGLLALAVRDLLDGDVPLGSGVARGYGAARGRIVRIVPPKWEDVPEQLRLGIDASAWGAMGDLRGVTRDDVYGRALTSAIGRLPFAPPEMPASGPEVVA